MSTRVRAVFVASALLCVCNACAQESSVGGFRDELLEPIEISPWTIENERLTELSQRQREDLLSARAVLREFFRSLERTDGDPRPFITDEYARQKGDRQSIRQSLIGYETTVRQIRVTDFSLLREDALELSFYTMVFSEGTYVVGDARATLRKVGEAWRVDNVVILSP